MLSKTLRLAAIVVTMSTGFAHAGTTAASSASLFVAPTQWQRGSSPDSAYALWDNSFTSLPSNAVLYNGSNLSTANVMGEYPSSSLSGWNVADANSGLITSTQHLYGGGAADLALSLTIPNYGLGSAYTTDFILQAQTATLPLDSSSFAISADGGPAILITPTVTNLAGSYNDSYQFSLPGNASSYVLTLDSPTSGTNYTHVALDALSVDTYASVPEPASLSLLGIGALLMLSRRRRLSA
jgi:hypothetical protein